MDFIVKVSVSKGFNSILTIMNHDYIKAVILLPYQEEIDALRVAKLYLKHMFPIVGLLEQVILDRDIRFIFKIFHKICLLSDIKQKIISHISLIDRQLEWEDKSIC